MPHSTSSDPPAVTVCPLSPTRKPSSPCICFGGADMRDVLITSAGNLVDERLGGSVLRARSSIPGLAVAPARV